MLTMCSITEHFKKQNMHTRVHARAHTHTHTNVKPTQVYISSAHRIL